MPKRLAEAIRQHQVKHGSGFDPIEAGLIGKLADNECPHGSLPSDKKITCDCFPKRTVGKR